MSLPFLHRQPGYFHFISSLSFWCIFTSSIRSARYASLAISRSVSSQRALFIRRINFQCTTKIPPFSNAMYTPTYRQPRFQKNVNHTFLVHRFRHSQILARLPSFTSLALFCKCEDSNPTSSAMTLKPNITSQSAITYGNWHSRGKGHFELKKGLLSFRCYPSEPKSITRISVLNHFKRSLSLDNGKKIAGA